jgi:hypothetical protein
MALHSSDTPASRQPTGTVNNAMERVMTISTLVLKPIDLLIHAARKNRQLASKSRRNVNS